MKIFFFILFITFSFTSCKRDMVKYHLEKGLEELEHTRPVNKFFFKNYQIKKIGFFKIEKNHYKIAMLLNDDIKPETISSYTLGMHAKTNKELMPKGKNYISWDTIVHLETYNKHKYIIRDIKTPVKKISSLRIFIYNLGVYEKKEGNQIVIRNIGL